MNCLNVFKQIGSKVEFVYMCSVNMFCSTRHLHKPKLERLTKSLWQSVPIFLALALPLGRKG